MKYNLSDEDRAVLDKRIAEVEKLTGAQIVLATTKRSDSYAEIPWKAFSVGASVSGLIVFITGFLLPLWVTNAAILLSITSVLASGILLTIMTVLCQGFARFFLSSHRKETETLQYAQSLFLSRELFATAGRRGILILISRFERQVVVLPDKALQDILNPEIKNKMISEMAELLKMNEVRKSFEAGLTRIQTSLILPESLDSNKNELSNEIISEDNL
jgi:putative membrane protein